MFTVYYINKKQLVWILQQPINVPGSKLKTPKRPKVGLVDVASLVPLAPWRWGQMVSEQEGYSITKQDWANQSPRPSCLQKGRLVCLRQLRLDLTLSQMVLAQIVHQCQPKGGEDKCYKNKPRLSEVGLQPSNALASLNKSG